jgi:hypothetical protein
MGQTNSCNRHKVATVSERQEATQVDASKSPDGFMRRRYDASFFFVSLKANSSISTRSRTIRSTHLSTPASRCRLARNAARAASSPGSERDGLRPLHSNGRLPGRFLVCLRDHEPIDAFPVQRCGLLLFRCVHRGHPVIIRTMFLGFSWKMILSLLPPSVVPINW